jgi:hypothetical protein
LSLLRLMPSKRNRVVSLLRKSVIGLDPGYVLLVRCSHQSYNEVKAVGEYTVFDYTTLLARVKTRSYLNFQPIQRRSSTPEDGTQVIRLRSICKNVGFFFSNVGSGVLILSAVKRGI